MSNTTGLFITFEGGEGSGKTTLAALLADRLRAAGRDVVLAREPGGTALGEIARLLSRKPALARRFFRELTDVASYRVDPVAELLLMEVSRAQLLAEVVRPALAGGTAVLCDRFADSSLAYQGYGRGLPLATVRQANAVATGGATPDITVLLDIPPEAGLARKHGEVGQDAIGGMDLVFHERVRAGYLALAAEEPARWLVLDALLPPEVNIAALWARVT